MGLLLAAITIRAITPPAMSGSTPHLAGGAAVITAEGGTDGGDFGGSDPTVWGEREGNAGVPGVPRRPFYLLGDRSLQEGRTR